MLNLMLFLMRVSDFILLDLSSFIVIDFNDKSSTKSNTSTVSSYASHIVTGKQIGRAHV